MGKPAPVKTPLPEAFQKVLVAAKRLVKPETEPEATAIRLSPTVLYHRSEPYLRFKTHSWPVLFTRLLEKGQVTGTFRTEGRHWLIIRPKKPREGNR